MTTTGTIDMLRVFYPDETDWPEATLQKALDDNTSDLNLSRLQLARIDYANELNASTQFVAVGDYSENRSANLAAKKQMVDDLELLTGQGLAGAGLDEGLTLLNPVGLDRDDWGR